GALAQLVLTSVAMLNEPATLVSTSCANAPTLIATTPKIRFLGFRKSTRPPNSPIRLGVNTAQVNPQNTDCTDVQKLIGSMCRQRYRHFTASSSQFANIIAVTTDSVSTTFSAPSSFMRRSNSNKLW